MKNQSVDSTLNNEYTENLNKVSEIITLLDGLSYITAKSIVDMASQQLLISSTINSKQK